MKFDKSKVYTALNADEVKVGSKGYFACNIKVLREAVQDEDDVMFGKIEEIFADFASCRFGIENESGYGLFYLVEEPKEKQFRPYKDTDEMIEDFKRRYNSYGGWSGKDNPMYNPLIWIKTKGADNKYLIVRFASALTICLNTEVFTLTFEDLVEGYTYLDGTPCGIEE